MRRLKRLRKTLIVINIYNGIVIFLIKINIPEN